MATFQKPSAAVLAGRARRGPAEVARQARIQWFIKEVSGKVSLTMKQRVSLATSFLRDRVVRNISRPVTKSVGPRGGRIVFDRSKPGEFPKADTTQLLKTLFATTGEPSPGDHEGYVGTPLSYGLILEIKMNRSFLKRTLYEEAPAIRRILTGPIK